MLTICVLKKYDNSRRIDLELVAKVIRLPMSAVRGNKVMGIYLIDVFGEKLQPKVVTVMGLEISYEEYYNMFLLYLERNKDNEILENQYGKVYNGADFIALCETCRLILPHEVDSRGQFIV